MKNLLTHSVSLLAVAVLALQARATPSWLAIYTEAYGKDASPSADSTAYTAYYCTVAKASELFDDNSSVAAVTSYFKNNFAAAQSAVSAYDAALRANNVYVQTFDWDTESSQYVFTDSFASGLTVGEYLAIILYQSGENSAVRVLGNEDWTGANLALDDQDPSAAAGTVGAWTAVVPEPTSALLLLLGAAGLALKRRHA